MVRNFVPQFDQIVLQIYFRKQFMRVFSFNLFDERLTEYLLMVVIFILVDLSGIQIVQKLYCRSTFAINGFYFVNNQFQKDPHAYLVFDDQVDIPPIKQLDSETLPTFERAGLKICQI